MITEPSAVWEILYSKHDSLFADRVMKEDDWVRLRSSMQRHKLQPYKLARVMLGYFWLLVYVAVLAVGVGVYSTTLVQHHHWPMLSLQSVQTFFSAITFALTLLLVFKTNSSYARWWEARKDVGQLVSFAHNITRQAVAYFPPEQAHLIHALARWVSAAMWVVKAMVRPAAAADLRDDLSSILLPQELDWLMAQTHKPLALGQALSCIVAAVDVDPLVKWRLDGMVSLYTFEFGACGRIYNTAIPFCYTRHTSRFLMCYLTLLPLLLWPMSGWASPLLAVVIAFLLLGVENIGAFIEEPFHVIAFDAFCVNVHRDIQNIMKMHSSSAHGTNQPVIGGLQPGELFRTSADHAAAAAVSTARGGLTTTAAAAAADLKHRQSVDLGRNSTIRSSLHLSRTSNPATATAATAAAAHMGAAAAAAPVSSAGAAVITVAAAAGDAGALATRDHRSGSDVPGPAAAGAAAGSSSSRSGSAVPVVNSFSCLLTVQQHQEEQEQWQQRWR